MAAKPDAVFVPFAWGGFEESEDGAVDRHRAFRDTFGPLLGAPIVYARRQGASYFVTADVNDSLLFPTGHPLFPQARYVWVDQPEFQGRPTPGLKFGYRKAEATPADHLSYVPHRQLNEATAALDTLIAAGVYRPEQRADIVARLIERFKPEAL